MDRKQRDQTRNNSFPLNNATITHSFGIDLLQQLTVSANYNTERSPFTVLSESTHVEFC